MNVTRALLYLAALAGAALPAAEPAPTTRPNVLLIAVDDLAVGERQFAQVARDRPDVVDGVDDGVGEIGGPVGIGERVASHADEASKTGAEAAAAADQSDVIMDNIYAAFTPEAAGWFDASAFKVRFAHEVKGFDVMQYMDRKEARRADRLQEATETILAAKSGDRLHLVRETADLWFHCLVLLARHGLGPADGVDLVDTGHGGGGQDDGRRATAARDRAL